MYLGIAREGVQGRCGSWTGSWRVLLSAGTLILERPVVVDCCDGWRAGMTYKRVSLTSH